MFDQRGANAPRAQGAHGMGSEPWRPDDDVVQSVRPELDSWRQGDVIKTDNLSSVVLVRSDQPLTQASAETAPGDGTSEMLINEEEVEALVVTSQTCDVVDDPRHFPHITLSPLVRLENPNHADEARRGYRPRYAPVPGEGDDAFADLARVTTIEKPLLVGVEHEPGLRTDQEIRHFQRIVQRHYGRFAFPDDLNPALTALRDRLRDKKGKDSFEGHAIDAVDEIRLAALPDWTAPSLEVDMYVLLKSREAMTEISEDAEEWENQRQAWEDRCVPQGCIRSIRVLLIPLDELDARSYLDSDQWDLGGMSPP
jgi:hypothetical protein